MRVKTGSLRNNLSRYLKRVRQTGETIVVLDRDMPVAEIRPFQGEQTENAPSVWAMRAHFEKQSGAINEEFELAARQTHPRKDRNPLD